MVQQSLISIRPLIFLHGLVMITVDKVEFSGIGKEVLHIFKQPTLVAFEGQDIISLLSHDLSRNILLATHGINRDNTAAQVKQFQ